MMMTLRRISKHFASFVKLNIFLAALIVVAAGCKTLPTALQPKATEPPAQALVKDGNTAWESSTYPDTAAENTTDTGGLDTTEGGGTCPVSVDIDTGEAVPPPDPEQLKIGQESIDHALELCQSAQDLWEAGDLDRALAQLDIAYATILDLDFKEIPSLYQQKEDLRYTIAKRILEIHSSRHIVTTGNHDAIPITLNRHVKREIKRFTGPEKPFFIRSLKRAGRYRPFITASLREAGLPESLSWLPLIESGFRVNALSPARALGLWQFIPSTGYKFGLKRDYYIDERLDPEKSTQAAIAYLTELHNIFGDWATVLAAYNCGEGRVLRLIRKQKTNYLDNFWDLYEKLPRETARYVPRFLAAVHIIQNPEKYGLQDITVESPMPYQVFSVKKQVHLKEIAKVLDVPVDRLKALNPELRYNLLPSGPYELRVPAETSDIFLARFNTISPIRTTPKKYVYHRIKRGDTLSCIARDYGTTVRALTRANRMSTRSVLSIGKVLKIPSDGARASSTAKTAAKARKTPVRYTVRRGDNLWLIAQKYGTTTKRIESANHLKSTRLHIGQKLVIPGSSAVKQPSTYWVKSGDNPFTIAKKYNMSLQRLLTLNHLTAKSRIYPGQKLLVE